ncbi:RHS repeat domain-containing protein [Flectobacillus roseus]|uniref:RHS repeat-associated core domain-containing protein n=1 Tax=Flectobacillus roseus TaxID=502259 RepID=A0ABT6Y2D0_9BACT|nr:RHS repeat-associated core domain-containing protein [Flectobacillus roseus]MDI9857717.1 RHS repeat-associated core domain-containing protein [Flectobacillus roseus]
MGKELQDGTNWLDYGARMYYPELGRWMAVDPLAEKRFNLTPYHYVSNNPINRIDLFGLEDVNGDGKDDGKLLPEVTVTAKKRDISSSWSNYINNLGNEGYNSYKEIYREHKLSPYNSNFSGAIYGRDANGQVQIPDDILDRIDQEVDDEAMLALAMLWASEQSGVDPNSFNFEFNPFARANFYNSYLSTGVSNEKARSVVTSVGVSTGLAYAGNIKLSLLKSVKKIDKGVIFKFYNSNSRLSDRIQLRVQAHKHTLSPSKGRAKGLGKTPAPFHINFNKEHIIPNPKYWKYYGGPFYSL